MKKRLFLLVILGIILMPIIASAQSTIDPNGILNLGFTASVVAPGFPVDHYEWQIFINSDTVGTPHKSGVIPATGPFTLTNFDTLTVQGDYAYLRLRSVSVDLPGTSTWVRSNKVVYTSGTGPNPPTVLHWIP